MSKISNMLSALKSKKTEPKKSREDYAEDALYREVWEEVHSQKLYAFMTKYSKHLIAGAIALIILVSVFQIWNSNRKQNRIAMANNYEMAIATMDTNALSAIAKNAHGGTADLAALQSFLISGNVSILEKLADDGETRDFRDLARIHLAGIKGDKMNADEFAKFMRPLDTEKSPFYYNASLLVAQKYLSVGDRENANEYLEKIDKDAPNIISATAQSLR